MTDEQIFEIAKSCGFDEFVGEMDDETDGRYWQGWDEQLLKFALVMHNKGICEGAYQQSKRYMEGEPEMTETKETVFTKENLDRIWTALEYTRATIHSGYDFPSMEGKMDYALIHKGRAHQSNAYLEQAINIINQMKGELK